MPVYRNCQIFFRNIVSLLLLACATFVRAQWTTTIADEGWDTKYVGTYASQASVNGRPAIAYHSSHDNEIKFIRAADIAGVSWDDPVTASSFPQYCTGISLAVVDGNPAFVASSDYSLRYVRANDPDGNSWGTPVYLESVVPDGGFYDASLRVVSGNPAIAIYCGDSGLMRYMRATNSTGTLLMDWGAAITVAGSGSAGVSLSMEFVSGVPAIAYHNYASGDLNYVRANSADGSSWGSPITLDSTGDVGRECSMVVVNGNPAVSYYDATNSNLKYIRANTPEGAQAIDWSIPSVLDATGNMGTYDVGGRTSLIVANGVPAISYYDFTNADLKFIASSDSVGGVWMSPIILDATADVGRYASLAIADGKPSVAYLDLTNWNLKFIRSTTATGTSWSVPQMIDPGHGGAVGWFPSAEIVSGNPAVAYQEREYNTFYPYGFHLRYVRAADSSGMTWNTPAVLDNDLSPASRQSLAVINGNPAISYVNFDDSPFDFLCHLKFIRATDAVGSSWGTPVVVVPAADASVSISLTSVGGNPAILYMGTSDSRIRFIRAINPSGTAWGSPVIVAPAGFFCVSSDMLAVVNGNPAIACYDTVGVRFVRAINALGTAWGSPVTVVAEQYSSPFAFGIVNGNPAIVFGSAFGDLKYVRATNASGTAWGAPVTIDADSSLYIASGASLAVIGGLPAISYGAQDGVSYEYDLRYVRAYDPVGLGWGLPVTVDYVGDVGLHTSLTPVNGNPGISYFDADNADLKFASFDPPNQSTDWTFFD